jgi:hypothetical protein
MKTPDTCECGLLKNNHSIGEALVCADRYRPSERSGECPKCPHPAHGEICATYLDGFRCRCEHDTLNAPQASGAPSEGSGEAKCDECGFPVSEHFPVADEWCSKTQAQASGASVEDVKLRFANEILFGRFAHNERIGKLTGRDVAELFECLSKLVLDEFVRRVEAKAAKLKLETDTVHPAIGLLHAVQKEMEAE